MFQKGRALSVSFRIRHLNLELLGVILALCSKCFSTTSCTNFRIVSLNSEKVFSESSRFSAHPFKSISMCKFRWFLSQVCLKTRSSTPTGVRNRCSVSPEAFTNVERSVNGISIAVVFIIAFPYWFRAEPSATGGGREEVLPSRRAKFLKYAGLVAVPKIVTADPGRGLSRTPGALGLNGFLGKRLCRSSSSRTSPVKQGAIRDPEFTKRRRFPGFRISLCFASFVRNDGVNPQATIKNATIFHFFSKI